MSTGPENTFISSVHKYLPPDLYRMKNHNQYNGGIADCWYSGSEGDLWVEYKFIKVPVRDSTLIDLTTGGNPALSYLQQEWLRARCVEGRNVGVIIGSKDGGVWCPGESWSAPLTARQFRDTLKTRRGLAEMITVTTCAKNTSRGISTKADLSYHRRLTPPK